MSQFKTRYVFTCIQVSFLACNCYISTCKLSNRSRQGGARMKKLYFLSANSEKGLRDLFDKSENDSKVARKLKVRMSCSPRK